MTFANLVKSDRHTWYMALVQYADRSGYLGEFLSTALDYEASATKLRRVSDSFGQWDRAILGVDR